MYIKKNEILYSILSMSYAKKTHFDYSKLVVPTIAKTKDREFDLETV